MALADYFHRSAIAAAQVLVGFDEAALAERLSETTIEVSMGDEFREEGQALADLTIRLLARFYPRLSLSGAARRHAGLATSINPNIEIVEGGGLVGIAIGSGGFPSSAHRVFAGSEGWDARLSSEKAQTVGATKNPFGAGAAACLAVGEVFRRVFEVSPPLAGELTLSTLDMAFRASTNNAAFEGLDVGSTVLVGIGAIGNGVVWALGRAPLRGALHLVDHQRTELSNLQRYVLAAREDDKKSKVGIAMRSLSGSLKAEAHQQEWAEFVATHGYAWEQVLVAVDSAQGRREVQASVPKWIANAWTQPGDLGVSVHPWNDDGACLACLYLPAGPVPGEDRVIGAALGLTSEPELLQIRRLLHADAPLPLDLFPRVSSHLGIELEQLASFADRPLRALYVEGLCGGALLPLNRVGRPTQEVHVPIAHQSALAGVLLGGRLVAKAMRLMPDETSHVTRIDVLRPGSEYPTQPVKKDSRGICICQDRVYQEAYQRKYGPRRDSK